MYAEDREEEREKERERACVIGWDRKGMVICVRDRQYVRDREKD